MTTDKGVNAVWLGEKEEIARNITEAFKEISRLSMEDVTLHKSVSSETIVGMEDAADLIDKAVRDKIPVTVVGDYDVDGISSTAILWYMLRYLGIMHI